MKLIKIIFFYLIFFLIKTLSATSLTLIPSVTEILPHSTFEIDLMWFVPPNAYIGPSTKAAQGFQTKLDWELPENLQCVDVIWPPLQTFEQSGFKSYGYSGAVKARAKFRYEGTQKINVLTLRATWSICDAQGCRIENQIHTINFPYVKKDVSPQSLSYTPWFSSFYELILILVFAFLGGLILNLMPCVLPILGLKVLSLSQDKSYSGAYLAGVLSTCTLISLIFMYAKKIGYMLGWGFQLQEPSFVFALCVLFLAFSLNLFGVFEFQLPFSNFRWPFMKKAYEGRLKSFETGCLAIIVASPCTAPFMGTALSYSLQRDNLSLLLTMWVLGLGMALPFILLDFIPKLKAFIPKPGAWINSFKSVLGFMMMGSCIWLLWILLAQVDEVNHALILMNLFVISFLLWSRGIFYNYTFVRRSCFSIILIITFLTPQFFSLPLDTAEWIPYDAQKLRELRQKGERIFVDFTARWCLTCQVNKKMVLESQAVTQAFEKNNIIRMRADWTTKNPSMTHALQELGFKGIPAYAFYNKDQPPQCLSSLITIQDILNLL